MSDPWPCGKCGTPNEPEDRYCGECGAPHEAPPTPLPKPHPPTLSALLADVKAPPAGAAEGAPVVFAAALVVAAAAGTAYHLVARVFDLKILFPLFLGLAVAGAVKVAAIRGRFRHGTALVLLAALSGAGAYGIRQALDTLHIRGQLTRLVSQSNRAEPEELIIPPGVAETLRLRAETGIGLGRGRRLRRAGFWIFLAVEAAIAAAAAAASARALSRLSFCGRCRSFVPPVPVYRVNGRDSDRLADAVRKQKWKEAQEMTDRSSATESDRAEAILLRCGNCRDASIRVDVREGRSLKRVMHVTLPPESMEALAKSG